nr:oligosaccharide repeat unit polymerase [Propionicimonas sp.]
MIKVLLSHHYWYAGVWSLTLLLYVLPVSRLTVPLPPSLITFFGITIAISLALGYFKSRNAKIPAIPEPPTTLREIKPKVLLTLTLALTMLFIADWVYLRGVPALSGDAYAGYDPTAAAQASVGLPVVHVVAVALTVAYGAFLAYLYSISKRPLTLVLLGACVLLLLAGQNRGYAVFVLFFLVLFYSVAQVGRHNWIRVAIMLVAGLAVIAVLLGILGNLRSGYPWNDFTYFKKIAGYYSADVATPLDAFSWTYTYLTSPLANLANTIALHPGGDSPFTVVIQFLPETFSKRLGGGAEFPVAYVREYLNASGGFVAFYGAYGMVGMYAAFFIMLAYFEFWERLTARTGHLGELAKGVSVLFVMVNVFYNPFNNVGLAYLPVLVLAAGILHARLSQRKDPVADASVASGNGIERALQRWRRGGNV